MLTHDYLNTLYSDVMSMLSKLVVKREDEAHGAETAETARAYELYHACVTGSRYFYNFSSFDTDILLQYMDPDTVRRSKDQLNLIPEEYRAAIVNQQAERVIAQFEERNEYYRMLMGLPPTDERIHLYVKDHVGIDPTVPIYELSDEQISHLEIDGTIARLKEENPRAGYLDFLGPNKIDLDLARSARPFEILRLGPPSSNRTRDMFETEYYHARRFVMSRLYDQTLFPQASRETYHPFIGLLIISLAVRNTLVPTEADYYNFEEILNAILESYGLLSYFERFPFTYKRNLVLALDKILANKGTDGVLIDVCNLFEFDNFSANRYYLMKRHRKDEDGNVVIDSDDPASSYELDFVKSDIMEHEIDFTPEDMISYEEVTNADYLWQMTDEETKKMLQEEFNLLMTKYISVDACFDVTYLSFEVCCFINLVLYARSNLQQINVSNHYATGGSSSIWTIMIFLLAALARKSNFDGNIVYEPEDMAEILRFNYGDIEAELKAICDKYELQIDISDPVLADFDPVELSRPIGYIDGNDTVKIYVKNRDLFDAILQEMATTDDIRHYEALSNLKDLLFYSASEEVTFTKLDGSPAGTYHEMLYDMDPALANKLDELAADEDDLNELILYILEKLEDTFGSPELQYLFLNTANNYSSIISRYLRTAINVFKASSVQLESINIILYLGDHDPIRIIDMIHKHKDKYLNDCAHITDTIAFQKTLYLDDNVFVGDRVVTENT